MKKCTKCREIKSLDCFYKCSCHKDGLNYWCKSCVRLLNKKWRANHPEKVSEIKKRHYIKHKERLNKQSRAYINRTVAQRRSSGATACTPVATTAASQAVK